MKSPKSLSILLGSSLLAISQSALSAVLFTEYVEGSGNNKAIEISNRGAAPVDLTGYSIELYSNGKTTVQYQYALDDILASTLAAGASLVLANTSAQAEILDRANATSSVTFFNGNDVLLLKKEGVVLDRIGQLGSDSYFGKDQTLVRLETAQAETDATVTFNVTDGWLSYSQDTLAYLGVDPGLFADAGDGSDGGSGDGSGDGSDGGSYGGSDQLACGSGQVVPISQVQGVAQSSPLEGQRLAIEAVVTASLNADGQMGGYFVQEEDSDSDGDSQSSEGLYIYDKNNSVELGDKILIVGTIKEYNGLTELTDLSQFTVCASNQPLPTPAAINLPMTSATSFEAFEGMQVVASQNLVVNEVYNLGRYGEVSLSSIRRLIPTEVAAPGVDAQALMAENALDILLLDDGISSQNPDPVIFPAPQLSAYNSLRVGDSVDQLAGVMHYGFGSYRLLPTEAPAFNGDNARADQPKVRPLEGDLRAASFNVLNYFNGDGAGGGFPTARGADNAQELARQEVKLVSALVALNADIVALMELENDGFGQTSAVAQLTRALNAQVPEGLEYDYVRAQGPLGDDAIAVGLLYRKARVLTEGSAEVLTSANSPVDEFDQPLFDDSLNRPVLIQRFSDQVSGQMITVAVNHLKSKGPSNCESVNDCDSGDGQSAYNTARTRAALAQATFLEGRENVVIMGDLNAYTLEDPLTALADSGYTRLATPGEYSYVFKGESGNLDHALVSESLLTQVSQVQGWAINPEEPRVLDYNLEFKSIQQQMSLYSEGVFRSSDHNPVIVDLTLQSANQAPVVEIQTLDFWFWKIFISRSFDSDGTIAEQHWQFGERTKQGGWLMLPKRYLKRKGIDSVELTVVDDQGAESKDSVTIQR